MKSLAPNTLLQNRYLVVHLIGKGGMGDVYLAVDQRLGSAVALKRTFFSDDEMLGSAFEREAKTLARLRHPVLPKVSDHFIENEEQYLVMEHISGDDLSKRLEAAQKPFPLSWVLFWADQLLDALAYLHAHEPPIIHRDIKPQNLKLTDENSIILLDFGLSKNNTGESRVLTGSTGSIVGYTPHYAPMEQIRGTGTNPRSDLYSLAATLYQLMTNIVPSDALTRADALLNDMADPIKPINQLNPEVSPAVSQVILKAMEVSQERRFGTAREMQKTLRDAFANMQNAMTAQTVAFTVQNEENLPPQKDLISQPISASQEKTEVLNISPDQIPPVAAASVAFAETPSGESASANSRTNGNDSFAEVAAPSDAAVENAGVKQSDVKTEVFIAGSTPEIAAFQQSDSAAQGNAAPPTGNFSTSDAFGESVKDNANNSGGFAPEATVPLFNYDAQNDQAAADDSLKPGDSMFFTNPNVAQGSADAFATYTPNAGYAAGDAGKTENFSNAAAFDSQPQAQEVKTAPPPVAVKKKSGGKALAIVGGLFALLILAAAAAGGGWYYYANHYAAGASETPTPLPSPSFEVTPSPAASLPGFDPNANSNVSNSSDNTNSETNSNGAGNTDVETPTTPTPVRPVTPTPARPATPTPTRATTTPTPKPPTPKPPTPKPPIILQ